MKKQCGLQWLYLITLGLAPGLVYTAEDPVHYQNAMQYYREGNLNDALNALDHQIMTDPAFQPSYYSRCIVNYELGKPKIALQDCNYVLKNDKENSQAWYMKGLIHSQAMQDYQKAVIEFDQAIKINPNYGVAYLKRGNAKNELGDLPGSIVDYSEAIRCNGEDADAYFNRGVAYYNSGDKTSATRDINSAAKIYLEKKKYAEHQQCLNALEVIQGKP